jgi:surfactin synthase thioesterase subunit
MIWSIPSARTISGEFNRCWTKKTIAAIDTIASNKPGTNERKNKRIVAQKGTLGCGIESSLLPQREHAAAFLGFTCILGQSLMS